MTPRTLPPRLSLLARVLTAGALSLLAVEVAVRLDQEGFLRHGPAGHLVAEAFTPIFERYVPAREWAIAHPALALASVATCLGLVVYLARRLLVLWRNEVVPRL